MARRYQTPCTLPLTQALMHCLLMLTPPFDDSAGGGLCPPVLAPESAGAKGAALLRHRHVGRLSRDDRKPGEPLGSGIAFG
ncbi:hypothetical protein NCCP2165_23570 [Halomonas sp. NCCP-2165]|nr:hypothetical protein NCCP2165_23570 [Halomonas sp. NCCP-2165]